MIIKCDNCGNDIEKHGSKTQRNKRNFCNRKCFNEHRIKTIAVVCNNCGTTFPRFKSLIRERNYCCHECSNEGRTGNPVIKNRKRIDVLCDGCGGDLQITPYQKRTHKKHFCDNDCHAKWKSVNQRGANNPVFKKRVTLTCDYCGNTFQRKRFLVNKHGKNFCNAECRNRWSTEKNVGENNPRYNGGGIVVECAQCGASTKKNQWFIENRQNLFCSPECYAEFITGSGSPQWKGGRTNYGIGWTNPVKAMVRDRDNHQCQMCFRYESEFKQKLCVHHLDGNSHNNPDDLSNFISLCRSCHGKVEHSKYKLDLLSEDPDYRFIVAM